MRRNFKTKIKIAVPAVIVIIVSIWFFPFHPDFKEVYSTYSNGSIKENTPYWICIKDPEYEGFFNVSYLDKYHVDYSEWELDKYTYIVTFGYEMTDVKYSYSKCLNWGLSVIPHHYLGKLTLREPKDDLIRIYRLRKVDIECAFPDGNDDISFVS